MPSCYACSRIPGQACSLYVVKKENSESGDLIMRSTSLHSLTLVPRNILVFDSVLKYMKNSHEGYLK